MIVIFRITPQFIVVIKLKIVKIVGFSLLPNHNPQKNYSHIKP